MGHTMGLEARCECDWQGESRTVKAHLDSTGLDLSGPFKLHIDLRNIKAAESSRGTLRLRTQDGPMVLHLGEKTEAWAQFIKYPRSRIEKLGIKAGQRVLLVGLDDQALEADLASRECKVLRRETKTPVDVAMVLVDTPAKLQLIARYREVITSGGAVWVIRPKGKDTPVTEAQTRDAAKRAELVDIKVVSFSDTHSAEKLVIPKARRGA